MPFGGRGGRNTGEHTLAPDHGSPRIGRPGALFAPLAPGRRAAPPRTYGVLVNKTERVCVVSSDHAIRVTSGQEVRKLASRDFLAGLTPVTHVEREQTGAGGRVGDRLDAETRERLERLRRGE